MSSVLGWITPAVTADTRVCVNDRAGRGWSEPADASQDGAQKATDLHTLLHRGTFQDLMCWRGIPSAAAGNLATLSTNSVHRVIDGATHPALILEQGPAAATTQAILDVVSSIRDSGPPLR
jgi:hypothetical protein